MTVLVILVALVYPKRMTTSKVDLGSKVAQGVQGYKVEVRN